MNENNNFEDDLISQLRASHYYASNQDDVCDDIIEASRQLDKLSACSSLMLKAVIQVALNLLDEVDTENISNHL